MSKSVEASKKANLSKKFYIHAIIITILCFTSLVSCKKDQYAMVEEEPFLLGRGFGFSSATINVANIDSARQYFSEKLGFSLGRSKEAEKGNIKGTLTSRLGFPDMSSIELLSVIDSIPVTGKDSVLHQFLRQKPGVRMYTFSSSSIDSTYSWLTSRGFEMDSIDTYRTLNESPNKEAWDDEYFELLNLSFKDIQKQEYLPQFSKMPDFPYERMNEWNSFYNMQRGFLKHPNGALGVVAIKLMVQDIDAARNEFLKMGLEELKDSLHQDNVRFKIKRNQEIQLIASPSEKSEQSDSASKENASVFSMLFEVKNIDETYAFLKENLPEEALQWDATLKQLTVLKEYAYGLQLEFKQESEMQALMVQKVQINYGAKLDSVARHNANAMYQQYCALCHGKDREGYAADNAPSLRSKSLLGSSKSNNFIRYTIQFGRGESAMAGYYDQLGGPLTLIEIELLIKWLEEEAGIEKPIELSRDPVVGDVALGKEVYQTQCAVCHGNEGEGITAPALGNPMLLATATDDFLRYAIKEGRDGTPMVAFKDSLSEKEIDGVTTFLRSRASGWNVPKTDSIKIPTPENYILNPNGSQPNFKLREGRYVSAKQLNQAIGDSTRLVILDARSQVAWRQTHIPGSIPVPYYEDPEEFIKHIPKENTMIVAYCACPHAASGKVVSKLNKLGYTNTAILDEGILIWAQLGFPVKHGH
ncbi:c-type cytochrome [Flavobacteriaceae bacterium S0825]|uniref:c-type cytochrome n=1 Tax=Gaetbulibacter sp. S0825 TaxID=2720084 RepID=UPI0014319DCC|nr:c-type cytochrome [Gaetbulibacter sp. S0825]MCK0109401.1 c-type cytochrome [Flavobacteriaceae bacterium S0825]NIX65035.1 c-type cytochrome [Gaetbulibacter sp. S0825]